MGWSRDGLVGALLEEMIPLGHLSVAWPECKLLSSDWESLISNTLSPPLCGKRGGASVFSCPPLSSTVETEVTNMDDRGRQLFV